MYSLHSSFSFEITSPLKIVLSLPVSKKYFQHTHVQCLSKPSRTRKQVHICWVFQKVPDKSCFIDIIKPLLTYPFKILNPHRKLYLHYHNTSFPVKNYLFKIFDICRKLKYFKMLYYHNVINLSFLQRKFIIWHYELLSIFQHRI